MEEMSKKSRPWLAVLLSAVMPAAGYVYCGKPMRGVLALLIFLAMGNAALAVFVYVDSHPFNVLLFLLIAFTTQLSILVFAYRTCRRVRCDVAPRYARKWYTHVILIVPWMVFVEFLVPVFGEYEGLRIPTGGMEDTIMAGDYVLADLSVYGTRCPQILDVVIFKYPLDPSIKYIKRCVGTPGDTVELRDNQIYVDGKQLQLPPTAKHLSHVFLSETEAGRPGGNFGPFVVPDDHYFVLGDYLESSYDSRIWGPVQRDLIIGRAFRVYLSSDLSRIGMAIE